MALSKGLMEEDCKSPALGKITQRQCTSNVLFKQQSPHTTNHNVILILYYIYFFSKSIILLKSCFN